jgi:DNA-binding NarL/FixJ family response regulator
MKIRLVIIDDHALFRSGLVSLLSQFPELEVVGEAGNGREGFETVQRTEPDVVLLDVNMPVMGGVDTVTAIRNGALPGTVTGVGSQQRADGGDPRILMLTISKHDEDLFGAISAGADGYLLKNAEPEELRRAIRLVYEGKSVLSPEVTGRILQAVGSVKGISPEIELSKREMEVLECLSQGMTSAQVASELFISENTVKTHVRHILEKLEASNRAEAVSRAIQLGLIRK